MFSHELKKLLKNDDINKVGNILKKIRSKIEIIEKQRCWFSILNNRLYKKLQKELENNKNKFEIKNISKLNNILENYIDNGIRYSKTINQISKKALRSITNSQLIELKEINRKNSDSPIYESSSDENISEILDEVGNVSI